MQKIRLDFDINPLNRKDKVITMDDNVDFLIKIAFNSFIDYSFLNEYTI